MVSFLDFGGGDANLYAYVYINPIGLCDPSGLLFFGGFFGKFGTGSITFLAPSGLARQRYS
jgi:hypothetical protein